MSVQTIPGVDLAQFAESHKAAWGQIEGAILTHSTYGDGVVVAVRTRSNAPPLIDIKFNGNETRTFNPASFAYGFFPAVQLPIVLIGSFATWSHQNKVELLQQQAEEKIKQRHGELATKYRIPKAKLKLALLIPILEKLDSRQLLVNDELALLEKEELDNVLATYFYRLYQGGRDAWNLVRACRHLRRAGLSDKVLKVTDPFLSTRSPTLPERPLSALLTTRGGAYRDMGNLSAAQELAERAIAIHPSQYPHNLGAVFYEEGNPVEGDRHFDIAATYGASPSMREHEIRAALKAAPDSIRERVARHLLKKDAEMYSWVVRYLPPHAGA